MSADHFKPLDFLRQITGSDTDLSSAERAVLLALAMGTDNPSFKVRRSLSAISRASGVGRQYVSEMLDRPAVARYLASVERGPRAVQIIMRQVPDMSSTATLSITSPAKPSVALQDKACRPTGHDMSSTATPSARSAPSASGTSGERTVAETGRGDLVQQIQQMDAGVYVLDTETLADLILQARAIPDVPTHRAFWTAHKPRIQSNPDLLEAWKARGKRLKSDTT